jgi:uncharacterized protein (DUF1778 family)
MSENDEIEARKPVDFVLSKENWKLFMDTLENPPEPTEAAIEGSTPAE